MALAARPAQHDSGQVREISRDSKSAAMEDFSRYDLIIDARTEKEYHEDHIPGAINLPVVHTDEFAQVGTLHRTDTHAAYQLGVTYSLRNIATYIEQTIIGLPRKARILVYCWRGGKRSKLWFDALDTIGYQVQKLPGGWKAYRRWVNNELGEVPGRFRYHVLCGPTGCGKTRLLHALRDAGAQVLDLEALASHRGSVIGGIPGTEQPTQKFFDTMLLRELMRFDAGLPIWIEAESKKIGAVQLPEALYTAMHQATCFRVEAPMAARVALWREDYRHLEENPAWMIERLRNLRPLVGAKEFSLWEELAAACRVPDLFERLMAIHYDPAYQRSTTKHYANLQVAIPISAPDLERATLRQIAEGLTAKG